MRRLRTRFWIWLYTFAHERVWGPADVCTHCDKKAHLQVQTFPARDWHSQGTLCLACEKEYLEMLDRPYDPDDWEEIPEDWLERLRDSSRGIKFPTKKK